MAKSIADNTDLRLKTVLHVLTEGVWSGDSLNAGEVLARLVPEENPEHLSELLLDFIKRRAAA